MKIANIVNVLACAGILTANIACAADTGWYGGVGVGGSKANIDYDHLHDNLQTQGFTSSSITDEDDKDFAYKLFAGYKFNPHFALEGGYFDLGEFTYGVNTSPAATANGQFKARGLNLDAVGFLPFTPKLTGFGRVGVQYAKVKESLASDSVLMTGMSGSKESANLKGGLGVQYEVSPSLGLRAEWEYYRLRGDLNDAGVNTVMASLVMSFGGAAASPTAAATDSMSSETANSTASGATMKQVSYSEQSLFDFDSATLKQSGKKDLDALASEIKGMTYGQVIVTGHASRTGSDDYNMKLSERRAEAVKEYLITEGGLDSSRIIVQAKGENEPLTKPGECTGNEAKSAAAKNCLQPDRRVNVEIVGRRF